MILSYISEIQDGDGHYHVQARFDPAVKLNYPARSANIAFLYINLNPSAVMAEQRNTMVK